ncbi:MAG TPA: phosphoglycerate mutase family protein [Candidatus Limnocylindrales bacterium]|jgi:phosphohistidine phosphatase|nr:phosphoglycerate mutase family protein [Candidatus Limnocylindrales bacterium]
MKLYLLRHGIAIDRDDPGCPPEADRFLTPRGIAKTEAAARGLHMLGVKPSLVLTSPLLRAVQTAEIACNAFGYPVTKLRQTDALRSDSEPATLFEELSGVKAGEVLCVGHAPNLDEVIAFAIGSHSLVTALKKAGFAALEIDALSPPRGFITAIYTPKALRLLGE